MPILDCETPCALGEILKTGDCGDLPGIDAGWYTLLNGITSVTVTDGQVSAYTMEVGEIFHPVEFDMEASTYSATYSEDNNFYEHSLVINLLGKSAAQRATIAKAIRCCNIVWHLITANCKERIVGFELRTDDSIRPYFRPLRIGEHEDTEGTRGGGKALDLLTFTGKSLNPALYSTVGEDGIPVAA